METAVRIRRSRARACGESASLAEGVVCAACWLELRALMVAEKAVISWVMFWAMKASCWRTLSMVVNLRRRRFFDLVEDGSSSFAARS